ncbi:SUN domain-containing protein 1 isoform X2 [Alosa sapidissima]|uniref:SUN domain-containing protein 1 isoform X2 n=1 Tax=Alosa sapidissima TaxID=34773 RepID=UPI001C09FD7A|nr:SUN domain-containing protein 1 isoform X2 [Alosa sapidissima]
MTAVMEQWHRRMNMDFSPLHTYTPPQCAPDNTGYTYSLSSSYSLAALEFEQEHHIAPVYDSPRMSRKSLRLHTATGLYGNDGLDEQSHNHSVSYSSSSASGSTRRTVRSRRQQQQQQQSSAELQTDSQTLTQTLTQTQTPIRRTLRSHSSYVLGQAQTDASLSGSLLDGASLKEHATSTPKVWGTELEADLKAGRSVRTEHSSSSRVNGNASVTHSHTTVANGYICRDCSLHGENKDALTAYSSSGTSSSSSSSSTSAAALASAVAGGDAGLHRTTTSIYSSKRSQKHRTGVLACVSGACLHQSRRALTSVFTFITLLFHRLLGDSSAHTQQQDSSKGVLVSVLDTLWGAGAAFWENVRVLKWRLQQRLFYRNPQPKAHSSYCGSMNVKDLVTGDGHLNLNGSLCDDCKGSQHLESHTLHTHSSRRRGLLGALLALLTYTGAGVLQVCRAIASTGANVTRKLLALLWLVLLAPGKAAKAAFWWLGAAWYQFITLMSLLNVFFLTRCLPKLWKLLPFLLAFLLLLGLWYLGPSSLLGLLPVVNLTEWSSESLYSLLPSSSLFPAADAPMEQAPPLPPISSPTPATPSVQQSEAEARLLAALAADAERLSLLEGRVAALWQSVQQGERQQEEQHGEALGLYRSLEEQLRTATDRHTLGLWVSGLLEDKLSALRAHLERQANQRAESQEQYVVEQKAHKTRLAELEILLQALAAKTEEVQHGQKDQEAEAAVPPPPVSVGVGQEEHDALLQQVGRLEAELGRIRDDLQGVMGCRGRCEQLDTLKETVSAQVSAQVSAGVRRELQALFYGGEAGAGADDARLPESLLQWLSARFVRGDDLHASLAALEKSILGNVSLQLEQNRQPACAETVTQSVTHTALAAGMNEQDVHLIVQNALRLYSQDRTGKVDYALESGGGSILSTRCSETYETKTALMSLFGLPLWYFSQSPRVVIQPDVYPGNCWAFKGSQGYLVIRLSLSVLPSSFCLEHIPKALSPTGSISSAPRHFTIYGLEDEYQEEGKLLGDYTYEEDGESLQTFPVMEKNDQAFQIIEMRVLSNWGHPEYTCLYRFRVHGEPKLK